MVNECEIFERLRAERDRLGYNQSDFARFGGVGKTSQINYEKGARKPDSDYLSGIAKAGADVAYILTGIRTQPVYQSEVLQVAEPCADPDQGEQREGISPQERKLLENYRTLSEEDKRAIRRQSDVFAELNRMKSEQKDKKAG